MYFLLSGSFEQKTCWLQLLSFCYYLKLPKFSIYFICLKVHDNNQCRIQMYFRTVWTVWVTEKVLLTLFLYIFHVKYKFNTIYEYLKIKILMFLGHQL